MLVVLDGRPEWLAFAAGGYLAAEPHLGRWRVIHHSQAVGYGLAALFVALVWVVRLVIARYPRMVFADTAAAPATASAVAPAVAPGTAAAPAGGELAGVRATAGGSAGPAIPRDMESPVETAAPAGVMTAAHEAAAPTVTVLPQRKRVPATAAAGEWLVNAPKLDEIIPTVTRQ